MTIKHILQLRLYNQQITQRAFNKPGDVVKWFGAMQAQDYLNSLWAIGLRLKNATESDIENAIAEKAIVRTWPMRGTLHFVAPQDVRWMLKLLTPRVIARAGTNYRKEGLDDKIFTKSKKIFINVLQDGKQLTRNQLYKALQQNKISTAGQRGLYIIGKLAQDGLICFATRQGKQQTFALLDEWIPVSKTLDHEEALGQLAERYFASHGPATLNDFAWWSGLTITEAKKVVEMASFNCRKETIEGRTYYMSGNMAELKTRPQVVYLLPTYDEYLVAYKDRSAALDMRYSRQVIGASNNGIFSPAILVNGKVIGTWKRKLQKDEVNVEINSFAPLTERQKNAVATTVKDYGQFLKMKAVISK